MRLSNMVVSGATRGAWIICQLVVYLPLRCRVACGWLLGYLIVLVLPRRAAVMRRNIKRCFPHYSKPDRQQLYKDNRWNMGFGVIESATALLRSNQVIDKLFTPYGFETLKQYYTNQKPVILLMPHSTHMMLLVRICASLIPSCLLRRRQNNPLLDHITVIKCRQYLRAMCTQSDMRMVYKLLRDKQVMIVLPDHDLGPNRSVFAPFMGIQTATITAVSKMAAFADAKVMVVHASRDKSYHYHVHFTDISHRITRTDYQLDASIINGAFEAWVKQCPSQYYWCHRRFKTRPRGEANFYA